MTFVGEGVPTSGPGWRRRDPRKSTGSRPVAGACLAAALALTVGAISPASAQHVERLDELLARAGQPVPPGMSSVSRGQGGWAARRASTVAAGRAVEGSLPVLLIPALFSDSPEPEIDTEALRRLYFQGPAHPGTMPEFFSEASGGRFTVTGDVAPWHRTSVSRDSATGGTETTFGIGPGFGDYLLEALDAADASLDFGQFDNDGPDGVPNSGDDNGIVDALSFFFLEAPRSCGGPGVWPHFGGVSVRNGGQPWASDDARAGGGTIMVDPYLIVSASQCDGTPEERIAVIAHELGHNLGLPDLYHPIGDGVDALLSVNRRWVVGCFGLMAAGAWGCGPADQFPSFGPTHMSAWSRRELGWSDEIQVPLDARRQEYHLDPAWSSGQMLTIPLTADPAGEALLLEYRPAESFDAPLPGSGVLIYRFDPNAEFRPFPSGPKRYRISLLEADADSTLLRNHPNGGNRGEVSDIFALDGSTATLSAATTPSTRRFDGRPTSVILHSIQIVEGQARVEVSVNALRGLTAEGTVVTLEALETPPPLPLGGGVPPYSVALRLEELPRGLEAPPITVIHSEPWDLVLSGVPEATGRYSLTAHIEDAAGSRVESEVVLEVVLTVEPQTLLDGLIDPGGGPRPDQVDLLDREGNFNGRFDVGDVRDYLLGRQ